MKVRYIGETFGGEYLGLTNGKIYECIGIEYSMLRVIDDEGEDYLYSATNPRPMSGYSQGGRWEIVEDDEGGTLRRVLDNGNIEV